MSQTRFASTRFPVAILVFLIWLTPTMCVSQISKQSSEPFRATNYEEEWVVKIPDASVAAMFGISTFEFCRVKYTSIQDRIAVERWATDYPEADQNLALHFRQFDAIDVSEDVRVVELVDDGLGELPVLYLCEPGAMNLTDAEVRGLRNYLSDGGFLIVDDFWGESEFENFQQNLRRAFPDEDLAPVPIEHELFHCLFDIESKPQVLSIHQSVRLDAVAKRELRERTPPEYYGLFLDGDLVLVACHNTDLADGWERVDALESYRREYSEPLAYPMGMNLFYYALTR